MARDLSLKLILDMADRTTKPLRAIERQSKESAAALKRSREQLKNLQAVQKDVGSFRDLKRASQGTARAIDEQQAHIRDLTRQIEQAEGPTRQLTRQRDAAIAQSKRLSQRYDSEQHKLEELRRRMRQVDGVSGTLSEQQRELERRISATNREIEDQQRKLARLNQRQRDSAAAARHYARSQQRAAGMITTGMGGVATGTAALYGASRVLAPGVQYGEQMSELRAVGNLDKRGDDYKMLAKQSRHLGASTQFTATDVGGAQTFLARAGFTPKAIHASVQAVLNEALVGKMDLPAAADISSNIAGVFGVDIEKAGAMNRVVDVLTAASTHANVDIQMLGETMKYLGQASDLHVTMEQAAALSGILGNVGIQGTQAGTTLRQMMIRLTSPTKEAREAIKQLNLKLQDANGNLLPLPDILTQIQKATAGMGNVQRSSLLSDLFQARAGSGVAALLNNLPQLTQLLGDVENSTGAAQKAADTMADNVGGDLKGLSSAWQEIGISITDVNDGPLRDLIGRLTAVTRGIGDWIKANPKLASALTIIAGGFAAVVAIGGALTLALGSIIAPIALTTYGLSMLGIQGGLLRGVLLPIARSTIPLLIGAIRGLRLAMLSTGVGALALALSAAAVLIIKYWGPLKAFFGGVVAGIGDAFAGLLEALGPVGSLLRVIRAVISGTIGWFGRLLQPVDASAETLEGAASAGRTVGHVLGTVIPAAIALLTGPIGWLVGAAALILTHWDGISGWFADRWKDIKSAFYGGIGSITALLTNWSPAGILYKIAVGGLRLLGVDISDQFSTLSGAMATGWRAAWSGAASIASSAWSGIQSAVSVGLDNITGLLLNFTAPGLIYQHWDGITAWFGQRWADLQKAFAGGMGGIAQLLINWSPFGLIYSGITSALEQLGVQIPDQFKDLGSAIVQGLISGIFGMLGSLKNTISHMGSATVGWFKDKLGIHSPSRVFADLGGYTVQGYQQGLVSQEPALLDQIRTIGARVARLGGTWGLAGTVAVGATGIAQAMPRSTPQPPISFDSRPPVQASRADNSRIDVGGIHIYASPGMDEQQIAALVEQRVEAVLARHTNRQSARRRSALFDTD